MDLRYSYTFSKFDDIAKVIDFNTMRKRRKDRDKIYFLCHNNPL